METVTIFENINENIIQQLRKAENEIKVCVAWLTDEAILRTLVERAKQGVFIEIITLNDEHNRAKSNYFNQLIARDCKVYMIDRTSNNGMLHHKFCIIDDEVLITGSYNWTNNAKVNSENIIIKIINDVDDYDIINNYNIEFNKVLYKYGVKNEDEEWETALTEFEENTSKQDKLFSEAKEYYDSSLEYLKDGKKENALEFINEAIKLYPHQDFYLLRYIINRNCSNYLECSKDLFLYMNEIAINDMDEIIRFKEYYNAFIDTIKDGLNTYTLISEINQKTKINLGVFSRLNIQPHFFTYEELNPYPF